MRARRTRSHLRVVRTALLTACVGVGILAGVEGSSAKKSGNPLAGKYKGTNDQGYPVAFKVSDAGKVLNFSSMVDLTLRDGLPGPCPNPTSGVAAENPEPIKLVNRTDFYPKGKKFDFRGPNGTGVGQVHISGHATSKGMSGQVDVIKAGTPGNFCGSVTSRWTGKTK